MAKAKEANEPSQQTIILERLSEASIDVRIVGLTPVIMHAWSEKALQGLPGHPNKPNVREKKEARKPEEEALANSYRLDGGRFGMPATAFKAAGVDACRYFSKPSMVEAKSLIFVEGEGPQQIVPLEGDIHLREDAVRIGKGMSKTSALCYRYEIRNWRGILTVRFIPSLISPESIYALFDAAGRGGVGEWRPSSPNSKTGTYGTWRVSEDQ